MTDSTTDNKGPVHVNHVIGSSVKTRDVSGPFWGAVEGWLRDGVCFILYVSILSNYAFQTLKPTNVEVMPGGLGAVGGALAQLKKGTVSGRKLIIKPQETPDAM